MGQTIGSSQALVGQAAEPGPAIARVAEPGPAIVPVAVLVPAIDRVLVRVQVIVRAELEPELALAVVERELALAVAVLERDLVEEELVLAPAAELATDQPHGHLATLAETKSVTAAHPHGLPHLAAVDLVAAAETTREPAVAEAAAAWAAAE